jgi:Anti-sigma factor NepR
VIVMARRKRHLRAAGDLIMNVASGFDWDLDRRSGRRDGGRGSRLANTFGQGLRQTYRDVIEQGVPENLAPLIKRLEQRERDGRAVTG